MLNAKRNYLLFVCVCLCGLEMANIARGDERECGSHDFDAKC